MEFVGPVAPGGPDVTLYGTAKEVYEQILELNPSYDVWAFPEYAKGLKADGLTRENIDHAELSINSSVVGRDQLEKRDSVS